MAALPAVGRTLVGPPLRPMLARLERELPVGEYRYEPKWDGFRALVFASGSEIDIRSRNDRPLSRYFPELVAAFAELPERCVLDGEIVLVGREGFDFASLMLRLHPAASRVCELSRQHPASFVAFDLRGKTPTVSPSAIHARERDRQSAVAGPGSVAVVTR